MPIPKPNPDEKEQDFVSRCVSALKKEDPEVEQAQVLAVCYSAYRKSKGESMKKEVKRDSDGHIIVAENVALKFTSYIHEDVKEEKEENGK